MQSKVKYIMILHAGGCAVGPGVVGTVGAGARNIVVYMGSK